MSTVDLFGAVWRKSSRSGNGSNGNCVEVAFLGPGIAVRDSKNPTAGALVLSGAAWSSLVARLDT